MDAPLTDLSSAALTRAIEDNLFDFWSALSASPSFTIEEAPGVTRYVSGVAFPMLNGLIRAKLPPDDTAIAAAMEPIRMRGLPLIWWLGPSATPADIGERLERLGLAGGSMPGMAADLAMLSEEPLAPNLEITPVTSVQEYEVMCSVLGPSFGLPVFVRDALAQMLCDVGLGADSPVASFVGWLDGEPVACSTVACYAGVAGVYNIGVLEHARGARLGRAITLAAALEGRRRGYNAAILHSSEMGLHVYERLGFETYCTIRTYVWMPPRLESRGNSSS